MNDDEPADLNQKPEAFGEFQSSFWTPPDPKEMEQQLPSYEFRNVIGRGGMGAVYKAWQTNLDRAVAVKVLPPEGGEDAEGYANRFKQEARTMAKLSHPGIVSVYDAGQTASGLLYFVMEFIEGTDVSQMLLAKTRLPAEHALAIAAHVCDALAYAHKNGVVHRDIKPANIMVSQAGLVKVADFGLAKFAVDVEGGHETTTLGTPDFVAPEALVIGMEVDHRADLYAVGVMLYNMLTGEIPRDGFQLPSTLTGCDSRFDDIVIKAMQPDRELRFQSAEEIRTALNEILTGPLQKAIPVQERRVPATKTGGHAIGGQNLRSTGKHPVGGGQNLRATGRHLVGPTRQPVRVEVETGVVKKKPPVLVFVLATLGIIGASLVWYSMVKQTVVAQEPKGEATLTKTSSGAEQSDETADGPSEFTPPEIIVEENKQQPLPEGIVDFKGSKYQFIKKGMSWEDAKAEAEKMGGHLATLTSKDESEWVKRTYMAPFNRDGGFWIGARCDGGNNWVWVTGEPWSFKSWAKGEPNYQKGKGSWFLTYAQHRGGKDRGWHDSVGVGKGSKKPFLVEWSEAGRLAANNPAIHSNPEPNSPAPRPESNESASSEPENKLSTVAEIAALQSRMQALTDERVLSVYNAAIADLNIKYVGALEREKSRAESAGEKALVEAASAEIDLVKEEDSDVASEEDSGVHDKIVAMRTVYRSAKQQVERSKTDNEATLSKQYVAALQQLEIKFKTENRNNDLAAVRQLLSEAGDVLPTTTSTVAETPSPVTTPSMPAAPASIEPSTATAQTMSSDSQAPPGDGSHGRELAHWVTLRKGRVTALVDGKERTFTEKDTEQLPQGEYKILRLFNTDGTADNDFPLEWLDGQTEMVSIELYNFPIAKKPSVLRGMKKLELLSLRATSPRGREFPYWDDASLAGLPVLPSLTNFSGDMKSLTVQGMANLVARAPKLQKILIGGTEVTLDVLASLRTFNDLKELTLRSAQVQAGALAGLKSLRGLERLEFNNCKLDFAELKLLPELTWICFSGSTLGDDSDVATVIANVPPGVKRLHLTDSKMDGSCLAGMTRLRDLTRLELGNNKSMNNIGLDKLPVMPGLERLLLNGCRELNSDAGVVLAKHKNLIELQMRGVTDFGDYGMSSICKELQELQYLFIQGTGVTDEGMENLKELKKLKYLGMGGRTTSAALDIVAKLPGLNRLTVFSGSVDSGSLSTFRKARPDVTVITVDTF